MGKNTFEAIWDTIKEVWFKHKQWNLGAQVFVSLIILAALLVFFMYVDTLARPPSITALIYYLITVPISIIFASLFYWRLRTKSTNPELDDTTSTDSAQLDANPRESLTSMPSIREKLVLHVLLPGARVRARGDGLLQAAGIMAAHKKWKDTFDEIIWRDHESDADKAVEIIDDILKSWHDNKNPLCIICTMSAVAEEVKHAVERGFKEDASLKERTSIVFTVASATADLHDGENFFQHFVSADSEIEHIESGCKQYVASLKNNETRPDVVFLVMDTTYSLDTAKELSWNLLEAGHGVNLAWCANKEEAIPVQLPTADDQNRIAIAVLYDVPLVKGIQALVDSKFKGRVFATTTLSVPDWQQHLEESNCHPGDGMSICHTAVKGFELNNISRIFSDNLNEFNFDTVLDKCHLYESSTDCANEFEKDEKSIYKHIRPNYISAFCFDSVRLFAHMWIEKCVKISELELHNNQVKENVGCPFPRALTFNKDGKTRVALTLEELSLQRPAVEEPPRAH